MEITTEQLKRLLNEQKRIVIERLLEHTGYYNEETTANNYKTLPINKERFTEQGIKSPYPNDIETLDKYKIK